MNILIIGLGSIGQRHLRNLYKLDKSYKFFALRKKFSTPLLSNVNNVLNGDIKKKYNITYIKKLEDIKICKYKIDVAFVCTPSSLHIDQAIWLLNNNINLFVEKPIGINQKNIRRLNKLLKKKPNVKHMVGYQLKFNPVILKLKKIINQKLIGQIFHIKVHNGENIKDFHPYEDYRTSYTSIKKLGGGVVLCQIHEIDYLMYLFEDYKINIIHSNVNKLSNLDINVEDVCDALFLLKKKNERIICNFHLNFFERPKKRSLEIVGEKGKIVVNLNKSEITIFHNQNKRKIKYPIGRNLIFIKQIKYFIDTIKTKKKIKKEYNLANGIQSLKLALKLKN